MLEQSSDHFDVAQWSSRGAAERDSDRRHYHRIVLLSCAMASGAATLIYQVIWNRLLLVVFGSTTTATATVVAAFMGGMALGAWMLARYGALINRPARTYVAFELCIAGYALLFPVLLSSANGLYDFIWAAHGERPLVFGALRLSLGMLLLSLPTVVMGATLPLLLRILQGSGSQTSQVSRVYGLNALGAAAGAAVCGFWLLPILGSNGATLIGVVLNLMVAFSVYRLFHQPAHNYSIAASTLATTTAQNHDKRFTLNRLALVVAGFAAIAYEIVWTRLLILVNGSSTYTFSLVLTIYILGLALGSLWVGKRVDRLRSPELSFAHLQAAVALTAVAGIWLVAKMPYFALDVYAAAGISYGTSLILNTATTVLVLLPPGFLLGAAFPVAVRMIDRGGGQVFRPFGQAYAWTALGNVAGAMVAGTGLIAVMGLQGSIRLLAAVSLAAAIMCLFSARVPSIQRNLSFLVVASFFAGLVIIRGGWDTLALTSGVFKQAPIYLGIGGDSVKLDRILGSYKIVFYREGNQSVVTVVDRPTLRTTPHRMLSIDGKVDASTGADMSTQLLSGRIPLLLHDSPSDVLIIGLASGVTAGAVASDPNIETITVAEIEPAVVDAAREFNAYNNRILDDPRVNLVLDDGRHYLRVTRANFDIIISEPSNPWMSGPARLFTREFFAEARARLNRGGVFAQWVPLYGLSTALLKAELRTFTDVFPAVAIYQISAGDLLIVGSQQPYSPFRMAKTLYGGTGSGGPDAAQQDASLITGDKGLRAWLGQGPLNTDDNGLLEFGAPRYLLSDLLSVNKKAVWSAPWQADFNYWFARTLSDEFIEVDKWLIIARTYLSKGQIDRAEYIGNRIPDQAEVKELLADIALLRSDRSAAYTLWRESATPSALLKLVQHRFDQGEIATASKILDLVADKDRSDRFYYLQSLIHASKGKFKRAAADLARITHQSSAAAADMLAVTDCAPSSRFDVVSTTTAPTSSPRSPSPRHFDTLATNASEKCGPANLVSSANHGWMIAATGLQEIFRRRFDASHQVNWERFEELLVLLRRELEHELGQAIMQALLQEVESLEHSLLTPAEHWQLRLIIQQHIITPMPIYYRGVAQLWLGEYARAGTNLEKYLELLPEADNKSRAHKLLILADEKLASSNS